MPVFEYLCSDCGHISEILVKNEKGHSPVCEKCGSKKLTKQFSTFSAVIKQPAANKCRTCPSGGNCPNAQF